jgi:hypothetical protein|tara:strand:- start:93 stop:575 length:483 start_codon:yes stop_codon:yes gene_type:complete
MGIKNSDLVANFKALPQVANNANNLHGVVRVASGNIALATTDTNEVGDIVMFAPIPTNATITSVQVGSDSLGGSCAFDVGIYTTENVVKDADAFATAVADGTAIAEVRYEAANLNTTGQQLYELAGDSSDPGGFYYIAATMTATGGTAGDMAFIINYVVN